MAMLTEYSDIRISRLSVPPIIPAVQGDTGRQLVFTPTDYTIPADCTATYYIQKPSGNAVYNNATIEDGKVICDLTAQALAENGDNYGQIRIMKDEEVVTSFDFVLLVKPFRGVGAIESTTEMNIFDEAVQNAMEQIDSMLPDIVAPEFDTSTAYATGDYVLYGGKLYRFTSDHAAGAWNASEAEEAALGSGITALQTITNNLSENNYYEVAQDLNRNSQTKNGVTLTYSNGVYTVAGTASAITLFDLCKSATRFPQGIEPGKKYYAKFTSADVQNVRFRILIYRNNSLTDYEEILNTFFEEEFAIPTDATGMLARIWVAKNATVNESMSLKLVSLPESLNNGDNYYVGNDFVKRNLEIKEVGRLTYNQSFCIHDNKYYSTDGSHICVQDENFNVLNTYDVEVGHGNSFQLGSNNNAFISGWDDQKVYEIDLTDCSIVNTITLPTTGYTTCAVDDVNKLCYILQRDTLPSTPERYNFICYDYNNESIVYTHVTDVSFGALQGMDFYNNHIFMLYGLGHDPVPNGAKILNKNGEIVCSYFLDSFSSFEPEGICLNRDTGDLYFSISSRYVYRISLSR